MDGLGSLEIFVYDGGVLVWLRLVMIAQDSRMVTVVLRRASCSWCCLGSSLLKVGARCLSNLLIVPISCGGAPVKVRVWDDTR